MLALAADATSRQGCLRSEHPPLWEGEGAWRPNAGYSGPEVGPKTAQGAAYGPTIIPTIYNCLMY